MSADEQSSTALTPTARVVSLVPSVTETLLAWGVEPVAVTRFCEQPGYPTVGGTKNPDVSAIVALAPDLVIVDREENRREDAEALRRAGVRLHVLHIRHLREVAPAMADLRAVLGSGDARPGFQAGLETARWASDGAEPAGEGRVRAFVPIWRRPWMTVGRWTYATSLLEAVGVLNVFGDAAEPYPTVNGDEVAERRPDVVLAPSEPYAFADRHRAELEVFAPVVFVDGKDLFWWGARTAQAIGRLRLVVQPLIPDP